MINVLFLCVLQPQLENVSLQGMLQIPQSDIISPFIPSLMLGRDGLACLRYVTDASDYIWCGAKCVEVFLVRISLTRLAFPKTSSWRQNFCVLLRDFITKICLLPEPWLSHTWKTTHVFLCKLSLQRVAFIAPRSCFHLCLTLVLSEGTSEWCSPPTSPLLCLHNHFNWERNILIK